jgi:hypothetical protein
MNWARRLLAAEHIPTRDAHPGLLAGDNQGALELDRGNGQRAIALLQAAATYELASPPQLYLGTMYPVYVRGQALI